MIPAGFETELPPQVRRYLDQALTAGTNIPTHMRLSQAGELRLKPRGRWLRFTATQESSVPEVAFSWVARVRMLPLVSLQVVDRCAAGQGAGEVRLLGLIRVARDAGPHVSEGSVLRYLAELPWNPHALRANRELRWRETDTHTVEVATDGGPAGAPLQLHFDGDGNIVKAWTGARPRKEGDHVVSRPWGGVFSDYDVMGGVRLPRRAEVTWELPDGPFTWFRCTITSFEPSASSGAKLRPRPDGDPRRAPR